MCRGWGCHVHRKRWKWCTSTSSGRGNEGNLFRREWCWWLRSRPSRMIIWSRNGGNSARDNLTGLLKNYCRLRRWSLIRNHRWHDHSLINWERLEPVRWTRKWWWWTNREVVSNCRFRFIRRRWWKGDGELQIAVR
jgi:hypothetical protein